MAKVVTSVQFHQSIFTKGLGNLGTTLPSPSKNIADLHMEVVEEGVLVQGVGKYGPSSAIVPFANVVIMEIEEEKKASKAAKA